MADKILPEHGKSGQHKICQDFPDKIQCNNQSGNFNEKMSSSQGFLSRVWWKYSYIENEEMKQKERCHQREYAFDMF